jgi:hypothetical protein
MRLAWWNARYLGLAALVVVGCGPLLGTPDDDDGSDVGSASAPGTSATTIDPTETTGQECVTHDDCPAGYLCEGGSCIYEECRDWGCCDDGECCSQRGPDGSWEVRCTPPFECYDDADCWPGAYCTVDNACEDIVTLASCETAPSFSIAAEGTTVHGPSAVLAHPDADGIALLVSTGVAPTLEVVTGPTWMLDTPFATAEPGWALVGGDFDGDAIDDVVFATDVGGRVRMLRDDGTQLDPIGLASDVAGYGVLDRLAAGDVDGDGDLDLAAIAAGDLLVLLNAGDGSFFVATSAYVDASSMTVADLDADGRAEIITDGDDLTVYRLELDLTLVPFGHIGDNEVTEHGLVAVGDFDGDSSPDIARVRAANGATRVQVYSGPPDDLAGSWGGAIDLAYGSAHVADLDQNGVDELVLGSYVHTAYAAIIRDPGLAEACTAVYPTSHPPASLSIADLDGDDRPDVASFDGTGNYTISLGTP